MSPSIFLPFFRLIFKMHSFTFTFASRYSEKNIYTDPFHTLENEYCRLTGVCFGSLFSQRLTESEAKSSAHSFSDDWYIEVVLNLM